MLTDGTFLARTSTADAPAVGEPRCLVVDDLPGNLLAMKALLDDEPMQVITAQSGEEALELLLHEEFALALIDVQMPGMDGYELAEMMRASQRTRHIPLIFVTAGAPESWRVFKGYESGAIDFLFKPLQPLVVKSKVRVFLELYRQRQQLARQVQELERTRIFQERLLESSPDCIAVTTLNGHLVSMNEPGKRLLETHDIEPFTTAHWATHWPEESRPDVYAAFDAAARGGTSGFSSIWTTTADRQRWCDVTVAPVLTDEGNPEFLLVVARDVSEQKRAESALSETAEKFRTLAEMVPTLVWISGADGDVQYLNPGWDRYTGLPLSQKYAPPHWKAVVHPDDWPRVAERWHAAIENQGTYEDEIRFRNRHGSYRRFLCRAFPFHGVDGRVHQWFGTCTDIEEQRQTLDSAQDAVEIRDQFFSFASHELKTPLTSLTLQWEMTRSKVEAKGLEALSLEPFRKMLRNSLTQLGRLNSLVDDLLDITRIETGNLPITKVPMELTATAAEVLERLEPLLSESESTVRVHGDEAIEGLWDQQRVEQIITNLLTNALRYGEGKPIDLRLRRVKDRWACIEIEDRGRGINAEDLERIFQRFVRVASSDQPRGLGVGLFIVRHIVELHGGRVDIDSNPGQGTTFRIYLPLQSVAHREDDTPSVERNANAQSPPPSPALEASGKDGDGER